MVAKSRKRGQAWWRLSDLGLASDMRLQPRSCKWASNETTQQQKGCLTRSLSAGPRTGLLQHSSHSQDTTWLWPRPVYWAVTGPLWVSETTQTLQTPYFSWAWGEKALFLLSFLRKQYLIYPTNVMLTIFYWQMADGEIRLPTCSFTILYLLESWDVPWNKSDTNDIK